MVTKFFTTEESHLHIPIWSGTPELANYIHVEADGQWQNEFLMAICPPGKQADFFVAMDIGKYCCQKVTLWCNDPNVPDNLFDAIIPGPDILQMRELYPGLYREPTRQQIHFSPARGWMNDPNGLVYADGIYHMYFQHNPFANHHYGVNVSWGHATSTDGVHFAEHGDAIMPKSSKVHVASGSAIVDMNNISGKGNNTIIATYTDLESTPYQGRSRLNTGGGQNLLYSTDGGMHYTYFTKDHIIPVPDHEYWRDPKILQLDDKTFCIAVYETYEGRNCVSFYQSTDCLNWTFCSRTMDLYECPDLFLLETVETKENAWILYGANGKYQVGSFENFEFNPWGDWGYLDYGECVYAGQTFNNFDDANARLHFAWLQDHEKLWNYSPDEPYQSDGFSQSMSLLCRLELHKTDNGFRLFRKPIDELQYLRQGSQQIPLCGKTLLPIPGEVQFLLDRKQDASVTFGGKGFHYDSKTGTIIGSSGKEYTLCANAPLHVQLYVDTRSVEFFVAGQISMSYSVTAKDSFLSVDTGTPVNATVYPLESIWKELI